MQDDSTTDATVVMFCQACRRQFAIPLDDVEDLPACVLCGAREIDILPDPPPESNSPNE